MDPTYRINKQSGAVETATTQDLQYLCEKSNVVDGFSQLNVTKVSRTCGHVASTGLAA